MKPLAILGAGSWGTALALLIAGNGYVVNLWDHDKKHVDDMQANRTNERYLPGISLLDNIIVFHDLAACLTTVTDILIVVPSAVFREVVKKIKPYIDINKVRIAWGTKGLDPNNQLLHEVVAQELGKSVPVAILSGPSLAKEVAIGLPAAITISSNNEAFSQALIQRLRNDHFRVYPSTDIIGVELCGAIKNVLAIAAGISDGMQLGANARSAMITRGLAEMGRLCQAMGGQLETLLELAGVGDLIVTCCDDQSRNRRFGIALGKGGDTKTAEKDIGQAVEGLYNAKQIYELAQEHTVDMPITKQVYRVIHENLDPRLAVKELLARVQKS